MKYTFISILMLAATPALAHDDDRIISQASELVPWCQSEAEARYVARNITPYQWTANYHDEGNVLHVEGKLRVHGEDVAVHCRIARGARARYASIAIDDRDA